MKKENPEEDRLVEKLRQIDPDELSPREAWVMLNDLAEEAGKLPKD